MLSNGAVGDEQRAEGRSKVEREVREAEVERSHMQRDKRDVRRICSKCVCVCVVVVVVVVVDQGCPHSHAPLRINVSRRVPSSPPHVCPRVFHLPCRIKPLLAVQYLDSHQRYYDSISRCCQYRNEKDKTKRNGRSIENIGQ